MSSIIAFCGLDCSQCEAYIVTQADDEEGKVKLAEKWSIEYDSPEIDVVSVTCDGCHASERLGGYCLLCGVRKCALEKGYQTCAECPDFACEMLENILVKAPNARENLEALRG